MARPISIPLVVTFTNDYNQTDQKFFPDPAMLLESEWLLTTWRRLSSVQMATVTCGSRVVELHPPDRKLLSLARYHGARMSRSWSRHRVLSQ